MKCLRNPTTDEVRRVSDEEARDLARYGWHYVSKTLYKRQQAEKVVQEMHSRNGIKRRI